MSLLDRHLAFLDALREAGLPVSLVEGLDAVAATGVLSWDDRATVKAAYAATLVKRQAQRPTFDAIFDLYFPRLVAAGAASPISEHEAATSRDSAAALTDLQQRLVQALAASDEQALRDLAVEAVGRFGAMQGRGPGMSAWSAYSTLRRVAPSELVDQVLQALSAEHDDERARQQVERKVADFTSMVEAEANRRVAEDKGPEHMARTTVRPSVERLDFLAANRADIAAIRREIQPLARRLATRLTQEHHARRRGPLDFRRTMRASMATGGVPLETYHLPKRPHRTELVVLCDVSGSVANFAQFTLLLVMALREQFTKIRAFTFIDHVTEVTHLLRPQDDPNDVLAKLAGATAHAALWGRTNYGRAFTKFADDYADALGPRTSLLVLGDARSNYSDLALPVAHDLVATTRQAWWLNPEHRRQWGVGDSAAYRYGELMPMVECRNLTQLEEFVHDLV